jgi:hypothetical protein
VRVARESVKWVPDDNERRLPAKYGRRGCKTDRENRGRRFVFQAQNLGPLRGGDPEIGVIRLKKHAYGFSKLKSSAFCQLRSGFSVL